jgi:hypothetical protein
MSCTIASFKATLCATVGCTYLCFEANRHYCFSTRVSRTRAKSVWPQRTRSMTKAFFCHGGVIGKGCYLHIGIISRRSFDSLSFNA